MTTWPENRWFLPAEARRPGYVAYRVHAGVAIGLCDPVAAPPRRSGRPLLARVRRPVQAAGLVPCLFTVTAETARHAVAQGWQVLQVAEEAVIELPALGFRQGLAGRPDGPQPGGQARASASASARSRSEPRGIQMQVKAISSEWVGDKGLPEMGFTLGGVDEALDRSVRVGLAVDADATVHGVTSWMPFHARTAASPPAGRST